MQSVAPEPSFGSFQRIDNVDGQTLPRHRSSVVRVLPFVGLSALSGLLFGYDMCIIGGKDYSSCFSDAHEHTVSDELQRRLTRSERTSI